MLRARPFPFLIACALTAALPTAHADDGGAPPPLPGGSFKVGGNRPPCDASHDHCLRPQARFLVSSLDDLRKHPDEATVVFAARGKWWDWTSDRSEHAGDVVRTAPATAASIKPGDIVIFWYMGPMTGDDPGGETAVHTYPWAAVVVKSVDAKAGTFDTEKKTWPIRNSRVIVGRE